MRGMMLAGDDWPGSPAPDLRAMNDASFDASELCYTTAMIAWAPPPNMRALVTAGYGARELWLPGPSHPYLRAMIRASYDAREL